MLWGCAYYTGSRRAGWLLLALPRTWSPPYPAADAGAAGATAVDAALWSLASCVAECCLGPVMARVDQVRTVRHACARLPASGVGNTVTARLGCTCHDTWHGVML